ncbi:MAG: DUF1289 domain-containing protein [Micropepsaceae bacterium]
MLSAINFRTSARNVWSAGVKSIFIGAVLQAVLINWIGPMIASSRKDSNCILWTKARRSNNADMAEPIESPCTKVCSIDATTGWCLGCGRSMPEIASWSSLSADVRRSVIAGLEDRKASIVDRERRAAAFRLPGT